jgi:hypothetical protein
MGGDIERIVPIVGLAQAGAHAPRPIDAVKRLNDQRRRKSHPDLVELHVDETEESAPEQPIIQRETQQNDEPHLDIAI